MPILRFNLLLNLFRTYFYKKNNLAAVTAVDLGVKVYPSGSYLHVQNTDYARKENKRVRLHGFYVSSVGTMFTIMNDTQLYFRWLKKLIIMYLAILQTE